MTWYRRLSDRRGRLRFELVGGLAGVLGAEVLTLRDISRNGALVESTVPLPVESIQSLRFVWRDESGEITVRVRHVTAVEDGHGKECFRIGFEFLDLRPELRDQVDRLAAEYLGPHDGSRDGVEAG